MSTTTLAPTAALPALSPAQVAEFLARAAELKGNAQALRFDTAKFIATCVASGAVGHGKFTGSVWAKRGDLALALDTSESNVSHLLNLGRTITEHGLTVDHKDYAVVSSKAGNIRVALDGPKPTLNKVVQAAKQAAKPAAPAPRESADTTPGTPVPTVVEVTVTPGQEAHSLLSRLSDVVRDLTDSEYAALLTGWGVIEQREDLLREAARKPKAAPKSAEKVPA